MRVWLLLLMSLLLFGANLVLSHLLSEHVRKGVSERFILPSRMYLTFVPRDFQYGVADLGFVNTLAFIGSSTEGGVVVIGRQKGLRIYEALSAVTFYNPRYFDPYYVANAFLSWETGLYREAVEILRWGIKHLDDWRLPFYTGFIYFYFLGDNLNSARYLEMASKHPTGKEYNLIPLLASRLYYEEGRLEVAILLLEEQLRVMKLENMKKALRSRLETFRKALLIKRALEEFRRRYGRMPEGIGELEEKGLIPPGLRDHAGGKFYITADGKIRSEKVLFPVRRKLLEEGKIKVLP